MAFEVRVKSGNIDEAKRIASETAARYGDSIQISDVYGRSAIIDRNRRSYRVSRTFDSKDQYRSFTFSLKDLRRQIREIDLDAKIIEFQEPMKRTRGQKTYPYASRLTLTTEKEKTGTVDIFHEKLDSIAQMYGMKIEDVLS